MPTEPRSRLRKRTTLTAGLAALLFGLHDGAAAAALDLEEYLERAEAARRRGDWLAVASNMAEVINHRELPSDPARRSEHHLEYGRAMGVLCHYAESALFLQRGLDIALRGKLSPAPAWYELGALAAAEQKHAVVVMHLSALFDDPARRDRPPLTAAQWADARRKLAAALTALGKVEEAARWRVEGVAVPAPGAAGVTPYGTRCGGR